MTTSEQWVAAAEDALLAYRGRGRAALRNRVQREESSLTEAIEEAIGAGDLISAAQILCGFARPLEDAGHEARVVGWLDQLLASGVSDPVSRFGLHELRYGDAFLGGDTAEAQRHCDAMAEIARAEGSDILHARALTALCRVDLRNEDAAQLEDHAAELATRAAAAGDPFCEAFAPHMIANLREMQGLGDEAIEQYRRSSALFEVAGADNMLMVECFNLAACSMDVGDLAGARSGFGKTVSLMKDLAGEHLEPEVLSCLAGLLAAEGEPAKAARLIGAAHAALERADRVFYPAEAKAAEKLRAELAQIPDMNLEALIESGNGLSFDTAVGEAKIGFRGASQE